MVKTLYSIMTKSWPPVKPRVWSKSKIDLAEDQETQEPTSEEPGDVVALEEDFGEVSLAEALGVHIKAQVVEPISDSQCPPDTFTGSAFELGGCHTYDPSSSADLETLPYGPTVAVGDTYIDPPTPSAEISPPITPTVLEDTPPAADPIEILDDSLPIPEVAPVPEVAAPVDKPTSLDEVRKRIEKLKYLSIIVLFFCRYTFMHKSMLQILY